MSALTALYASVASLYAALAAIAAALYVSASHSVKADTDDEPVHYNCATDRVDARH